MSSISSPLVNVPSSAGLDGGFTNISNGQHQSLQSAAQQFEAMMMQQMLQAGHSSGEGWFSTGEGEDQANNQAMEIAQQQFASALAAQGGMGLAKLVVSNLVKDPAHASAPAAENGISTTSKT
jgi:Rod binding domain-containing protein